MMEKQYFLPIVNGVERSIIGLRIYFFKFIFKVIVFTPYNYIFFYKEHDLKMTSFTYNFTSIEITDFG